MKNLSPFILHGKWNLGRGASVVAVPLNAQRITSYDELKKIIRGSAKNKKSGRTSKGGWFGFLSYDLGKKIIGLPYKKNNKVPEVYFAYCDNISVRNFKQRFAKKSPHNNLQTQITQKEYFEKIKKIKEYLYAGETYQVNFSQKFKTQTSKRPQELFSALTYLNPSPYQFFCEDKAFALISNSPEMLVKGYREKGKFILQTRPIKGTIARGKTAQEDKKNIQKLLDSKKDEAELMMIVDLERNDLGKVCVPGSVKVKKLREIEKYSHVIHTSSLIQGERDPKKDVFDVIEALFPGGSVTGCPKKRTMEIIDELEEESRGIYCGSAGYILDNGDFEFNIMIRTLWLEKGKKKSTIAFRSGGGIVVDSDAKSEYEETLHKAKALIKVL